MTRHEADEYIKLLAENYPKTFFETPQRRRPLKSDIDADLKERGPINPIFVDDVLFYYTNHISYSYATKAGFDRVDLDGNLVGKVTEAEQREAEQKIREFNQRKRQLTNDEDDFAGADKPRRRAVIPATVLPPDEQALFARIESLAMKARSLRMENENIGAELAAKVLEIVRADVDKLIGKYAGGKTN